MLGLQSDSVKNLGKLNFQQKERKTFFSCPLSWSCGFSKHQPDSTVRDSFPFLCLFYFSLTLSCLSFLTFPESRTSVLLAVGLAHPGRSLKMDFLMKTHSWVTYVLQLICSLIVWNNTSVVASLYHSNLWLTFQRGSLTSVMKGFPKGSRTAIHQIEEAEFYALYPQCGPHRASRRLVSQAKSSSGYVSALKWSLWVSSRQHNLLLN